MNEFDAIALPYEVLRKSDGQVALSVNSGLLPREPAFHLFRYDLFVGDLALQALPSDVIAAMATKAGVLLLEVGASGIENIHEVRA